VVVKHAPKRILTVLLMAARVPLVFLPFSTCAGFRLLVIILMPQNRMLLLGDRMLLLDQWTPR
jgi:hypothetical protein